MPRFAILLAVLLSPMIALASPVTTSLPDAEVRGQATFRFVGFPLYEARLFTRGGAPLDWSRDFGLEIRYLRSLTQEALVESTMREFDRLGSGMPVRDKLEQCFFDVRKGDRYLAVSRGQDKIRFWLNGKPICTLSHPEIKSRFMAIFLGDNTRSVAFTRKLKGE